jgi:hypothetical protein
MTRRLLFRLLIATPMGTTNALVAFVGGVSFCVLVQLSVAPPGTPLWLPYALMWLGALVTLRGLLGFMPRTLIRSLYVDRRAYAKTLLDESRSLDVARLPSLAPRLDGPEERATDLGRLHGRVVLEGGHGSGKSRLAIQIAAERLEAGQRGLHIRLSGWTTSLEELARAAFAAAAAQPRDASQFEAYLSRGSFLVLDSVDEVPHAQRDRVGEQIRQFSAAHPGLEMVVTARPTTLPQALMDWDRVGLAPLTHEQIEQVLGQPMHRLALPRPIEALASNPLMLGLLKIEIDAGRVPRSEDALLDAYIGQLVSRQGRRDTTIDGEAGERIAEDLAWEWLGSRRIGLAPEELRTISAAVAVGLRDAGILAADALVIERWVKESGLATVVRGQALPAHRALLDHLAGRAVPRHDLDASIMRDEFREPIARYVGRMSSADAGLLRLLDERGTDLEFLARCSRLVDRGITWPSPAEDFAALYIAELRRLADGPLSGLGVVPPAVRVLIDRRLTFISQEADPAIAADEVRVVKTPPRMFMTIAKGVQIPIASYRMGDRRGQEIQVKVPHLAALESARAELLHRLDKQLLPDEGPDITHERLSRYTRRLWQVLSAHGQAEQAGFSRDGLSHLSTRDVVNNLVEWLQSVAQRPVSRNELAQTLIVLAPPRRVIMFDAAPSDEDPYDPSQQRSGFAVHGAPLLLLADRAEALGIADLPLHPLGLRPDSRSDTVLSLPSRPHGLDRDQATLFVSRHELARMRSIRHLVQNSFPGLADRLPAYATLPWRVSVVLKPGKESWSGGWSIEGRIERKAKQDEVLVVEKLHGDWSFSRTLLSYESVTQGSYKAIHSDLEKLLRGERALGAEDL